jgi:hypothetical protein
LSGTTVLLVSALAQAQCTKDTDCKGNRVCEAGKCTSPASALPPAPPAPPGAEAPANATPAPGIAATAPAPADATAPPAAPTAATPVANPVDLQLQPALDGSAPSGATAPLERDEPQTHRRSKGAMIVGIAMVSVGPIALLGALAARNAQERCDNALERDYPDHRLPPSESYRVDDCDAYSLPVYLFGIGGAVLTAGGIPLIVYGAKSVRNDAPRASLRVLPWAGLDSGGVRLRLEL